MTAVNVVPLNADLARVLASWVRSRAEATQCGGVDFPWPTTAEAFLAMTREPGRQVKVLLDAQAAPVATGSIVLTPENGARIGRVLVDPNRRGEGFGRAIMEALLEEARGRDDIRVVRLAVYEDNAAARSLYESMGFVASQEPGRAAVVDGRVWRSIAMERPI